MKRKLVPMVLVALLAAVLLTPLARAEERANVPEKLKWNTADLYASEDAWYQAKDAVAAGVPKMADFQGKLGESAAAFYGAISAMEALDKDLTQLQVYASMRGDEDTRLAKPREMNQTAEQLAVQFYSTISYFAGFSAISLSISSMMEFISWIAALNGPEVVMSTPAPFSRSIGYFDEPEESIAR